MYKSALIYFDLTEVIDLFTLTQHVWKKGWLKMYWLMIKILKGALCSFGEEIQTQNNNNVEESLSKILNPKIAPDVQLAPCVSASAISKGPAMSWRMIQDVPWPSPIELTGIGPSNPRG